jgi:hypothetical protein
VMTSTVMVSLLDCYIEAKHEEKLTSNKPVPLVTKSWTNSIDLHL